ncbi:PQQ-binding-like beta-propeller repeat protein [Rhodococcus sp. H29-C3]|uniref:outer membrane protein assembly factor BamB family protein n=1 Tax=Rhodococcus sp. H29-C3 TaxID=3046307 RepID=UPI0024B9B6D5|nr:PQQ-binding-like beta-propeller repeat protein [Rhodococcus sp. H29-C3]MDJ0359834.1 PQQ-binding-like beta-propeller repeat protein [Rhodococcus sp. H29-C3]
MELTRRERSKLGALGVAVVVGIVFITVRVALDETASAGGPPERSAIDTSLAERPEQAIHLDPHVLSDNGSDVLLAMPYKLDMYYGYGGVLGGNDVVVAATGYPLPTADLGSGTGVGPVTLVGVDTADGSPLWKTIVGRVSACSDTVESVVIACWSDRRIVFVDTSDGTLLSDIGTEFDVMNVRFVDDNVYVVGNSDRSPILTRGTATDISADYLRTFPASDDLAYVAPLPEFGIAMTTYRGSGGAQYTSTVHDLDTDAERFVYEGDSLQALSKDLFVSTVGIQSGSAGTQNLLDGHGELIRAIPIPSAVVGGYPSLPSTPVPAFAGDGAYDAVTGAELWRNPLMVEGTFAKESAVVAVVGRTVVVADPEGRTIVGLDVDTGEQRWLTPWQDAYWVRGGLTDGEYFVFGDYTGTHALRVRDGAIMWSLPLPDGADPRVVQVGPGGGHVLVSSATQFTIWT